MRPVNPPTLKFAFLLAAGVFVCGAIPQAAHAQIGIYIGQTPPPLRYEDRPPMPAPGYAWVDGFYEPWQGGYRWRPGYWNQPPYAGANWVHPHYDHYPEGWHYHEGYWGREEHDDHHWDDRRGQGHGDHHGHDDHH